MTSPVAKSLDEALAAIGDGCLLVVPREVSGVPMAATRALIRRGVRRLHLVALPTSSLQADLLIGAACVATLETSAVSLGEFGPAPRFTAAVGSDVLKYRDDWKAIDNPFGDNDPIVLLPAIKPEVALIHAPMADCFGNVWIGRQRELATMAHAAAKTVVTVEKLHDGDLLADPLLAAGTLPGFYVDSIAVAERGCWPLPLPDHYVTDAEHLALYAKLAATAEGFAEYLERYVYERRAA
jgi:glutaconate CoA-transferase subunit A